MNGCVADISATSAIIDNPAFFIHGDTFLTIRYIGCTSRAHAIGFGINGCPDGQQVLISGCVIEEASADPVQEFHAIDLNNGSVSPANHTTITVDNCLADGYGYYLYGLGWNAYTTCMVNKARFIQRKNQACVQFRAAAVEVKNSSFYAPASVGYSGLEIDAAANINWHNNVVDGFTNGTEQFSTPTYTATNNLWHNTGGITPAMRVAGTYFPIFGDYRAAWETTSDNSDPIWVETPDLHHNFTLQNSSPAIALSAGFPAYATGTSGSGTVGSASSSGSGTPSSSASTTSSVTPAGGAASSSGHQCGLGSILGSALVLALHLLRRNRN